MANLVTSTENLGDTGVWTANSTTVTANTFAAPAFAGGSAGMADTVADNSSGAQGSIFGTYYGITANTAAYVFSVYIRKDAVTTRWPDFAVQINSGVIGSVNVNTSTGAIADGGSAPAASGMVDIDSTWWRLWMQIANNGTGTAIRCFCFPDHKDGVGGGDISTGTGSVVLWGLNITQSTTVQTYEPEPAYSGGTTVALTGVSATGSVGIVTPPAPLTRLVINTGSSLNDPTAETIRSGFTKVNTMMPELYTALAPPTGSVLVITTGSAVNDPAAESLRSAFGKVNTMATNLYAVAGGTRPVINTGSFNNDPSAESTYSAFTKINTITSDLYAAAAAPVYGPRVISQPAGSTAITAGATSATIQSAVTAAAAGTTFWFPAGTYPITSAITPKTGDTFVGAYGAIFDGSTWSSSDGTQGAFRAMNQDIDTVTIDNLVIQYMPQRGVMSYVDYSNNWTVRYCEIHHCHTGIELCPGYTISHCWIHHNVGPNPSGSAEQRGGGYSGGSVPGVTVEYSDISYNGSEQKIAGLIVSSGSADTIWRHNFVHHNQSDGIWHDTTTGTVLVENNIVEDNGRDGISMEACWGGTGKITIRNNIVRRNVEGLYLDATMDCAIYGNTLAGNTVVGFSLYVDERIGLYGNDLANLDIHDNSVTVPSGAYAVILAGDGIQSMTPYYNPATKNNHFQTDSYFAPTTTGIYFIWNGSKSFTSWQGVPHDSAGTIAIG